MKGKATSAKADFFKKNDTIIAQANFVAHALVHPIRRKIIAHLMENKKSDVTELRKKAKSEQSITSQHLGVLRRAQLVTFKREGKHIFYSLHKANLNAVTGFLKGLSDIHG